MRCQLPDRQPGLFHERPCGGTVVLQGGGVQDPDSFFRCDRCGATWRTYNVLLHTEISQWPQGQG